MLIGYPGSKLLQVHEYFQSLGLDIWDAWTFFRLLDADGGGEAGVSQSQLLRNLDQIVSRDIVYIHIHIYIYTIIYECIDTSVIALCFRSECHNEYVLHANGRAGLQGGSGGQVR